MGYNFFNRSCEVLLAVWIVFSLTNFEHHIHYCSQYIDSCLHPLWYLSQQQFNKQK